MFAEDRSALRELFENAKEHSTLIIPPGEYLWDGGKPIELRSDLTVSAYGARFVFPRSLEDQARLVMFQGKTFATCDGAAVISKALFLTLRDRATHGLPTRIRERLWCRPRPTDQPATYTFAMSPAMVWAGPRSPF